MEREEIIQVGMITHFFSKINVAVVELNAPLSVRDHILVKGPSTDFEMTVDSMQIEHKSITNAESGQSIGFKMTQQAKVRDMVYKRL